MKKVFCDICGNEINDGERYIHIMATGMQVGYRAPVGFELGRTLMSGMKDICVPCYKIIFGDRNDR